jgi:hypothetical protein
MCIIGLLLISLKIPATSSIILVRLLAFRYMILRLLISSNRGEGVDKLLTRNFYLSTFLLLRLNFLVKLLEKLLILMAFTRNSLKILAKGPNNGSSPFIYDILTSGKIRDCSRAPKLLRFLNLEKMVLILRTFSQFHCSESFSTYLSQ